MIIRPGANALCPLTRFLIQNPWTTVREIEVAYLTDPRVQAVIASEQITLCNFDVFKNRFVGQDSPL
jgi:hypothetical protein